MRERDLRRVLLIKAIEEADREGTIIPPADREAAARDAARNLRGFDRTRTTETADGRLGAGAHRLLAARAAILRRQVAVRHPFVQTVLDTASGAAVASWLMVLLSLVAGFSLSSLEGGRRIDILAPPLLGLVLWNLLVYILAAARLLRRRSRKASFAGLLANAAVGRAKRFIAKSAAFNTTLAEALSRFAEEWSQAMRPLLVARALRLLHLCAAAVGIGLLAGLYLRGMVLDYQAGWESTFLDAGQVRALLAFVYAPASALTGVPIPGEEHLAAIRMVDGQGGETAAAWIHLLAATGMLFIVLPRVVLALALTAGIARQSLRAPLPASLTPYFRIAFGSVEGGPLGGRAWVLPYAYEPAPQAVANLRELLPAAFGRTLEAQVRAPVPYGQEDEIQAGLTPASGEEPDLVVLLFNLAATPEEENHGVALAGVRDWLERVRAGAQLLVVVDAGPYAARMGGADRRLAERREVWRAFVAARGLDACFVDLSRSAPPEGVADHAQQLRAAARSPAV